MIAVTCERAGEGWRCRVTVGDDPGHTSHDVTVSQVELERYAPDATEPTDLVERSFAFLLEREPRESILRRFELSVIERYFPTYRREIGGEA